MEKCPGEPNGWCKVMMDVNTDLLDKCIVWARRKAEDSGRVDAWPFYESMELPLCTD